MRLALFRLTTRRTMILVAVVGTLLGSGVTVKRLTHLRAVYRGRADYHDREERIARGVMKYTTVIKDAEEGKAGESDNLTTDPNVLLMAFAENVRELRGSIARSKGVGQGAEPEAAELPTVSETEKTLKALKESMGSGFDDEKAKAIWLLEDKLQKEMVGCWDEVAKATRSKIEYHARLKEKIRARRRPPVGVGPGRPRSAGDRPLDDEEQSAKEDVLADSGTRAPAARP